MPARKKWAAKEWVANCNKLAGGWADEKAGVCYSLQGKRTTSDFPFSDNAAVGKMIKKKGNIFGIDSMKDFVHSVLDCAKTCNESHCGKTPKGLSKSVWAEGNIEKAKGNASKLATCSISIPVLDKDSLCDRDGGEDKKFPFNIDAKKCTMKIRQSDGRRFSDGKYEVTGMLGEVLAGKKSCGDKNAFNEYKFRDASVACSN